MRSLLLGVLMVFAAASCSKKADAPAASVGAAAGKVVELTGKVSATRDGKTRELAVGAEVFRDDQIETAAAANVTIELFHNGAKWSVVANKQSRVDASLAWGLDKQEAAKAVEHNSAAAGRNAERSAADTATTTAMKDPPKPGAAAPMTESMPAAPAAPMEPAAAAGSPPPNMKMKTVPVFGPARGGKASVGGEGGGNATPPPPPPPPPPADKEELSAPRTDADQLDGSEAKGPSRDEAAPRAGNVSPTALAEKQRPALQKCLDDASPRATNVTLEIAVRTNKNTTTVTGTNVTPKVRACMDGIVQKIEFQRGVTLQLELKF
jgi:hypothetical protein